MCIYINVCDIYIYNRARIPRSRPVFPSVRFLFLISSPAQQIVGGSFDSNFQSRRRLLCSRAAPNPQRDARPGDTLRRRLPAPFWRDPPPPGPAPPRRGLAPPAPLRVHSPRQLAPSARPAAGSSPPALALAARSSSSDQEVSAAQSCPGAGSGASRGAGACGARRPGSGRTRRSAVKLLPARRARAASAAASGDLIVRRPLQLCRALGTSRSWTAFSQIWLQFSSLSILEEQAGLDEQRPRQNSHPGKKKRMVR